MREALGLGGSGGAQRLEGLLESANSAARTAWPWSTWRT